MLKIGINLDENVGTLSRGSIEPERTAAPSPLLLRCVITRSAPAARATVPVWSSDPSLTTMILKRSPDLISLTRNDVIPRTTCAMLSTSL